MKNINSSEKITLLFSFFLLFSLSTIKAQQNARSDDANDSFDNHRSWSFTIDNDNNNSAPGYFRWWTDGGENVSKLAMQLFTGSNRKLTVRGNSGDGILELLAGQDDQEFGNPYILFSQTSSSNSRAAIFMDGWSMLTFSNNSDNPYNKGFRFVNGIGKTYPILNAQQNAGAELMRITEDGKVGIGTSNPTEKLEVNTGKFKITNLNNSGTHWDNLTMWADNNKSYIQSNGDENGLQLSSNTGNKIILGDINDKITMADIDDKFRIISSGNNAYHLEIGAYIGGGYGDFGMRANQGNINLVATQGSIRYTGTEHDFTGNITTNGNITTTNAEFKSLNIRTLGALSSGAYRYDVHLDAGGVGYQIGTGLVQGTNNSTKMAISLETKGLSSGGGFENAVNAVEFISDSQARRVDAYFNRNVYARESFAITGTDNLKLGLGAGTGIPKDTQGTHVFIGKDAGRRSGFDAIAVIDYSDNANTNPITGTEYLDNNSVFVLNNSADLTKPLLFGNFANDGLSNSMAQLAINTHHVIDSVALTVSGAVHIGPKNMNPITFPSQEGYADALLWVEKGIVTEDVTYAFTSNWNDWPDYVFDKEYDLMKLNELGKYIRKEKHLPGIVSRDEVKKDGVKSRELITNLLLKIEELTLYTIDQEEKIEEQKVLNQQLLERLVAIEEQLKN